jgi:6-phosphogluconolactonase
VSAHWNAYTDANSAAEACAHHILALLEPAISGNSEATLGVSGGSTPKLLFQHLVQAQFDWKRVHLFWVDERVVSPDSEDSNYKLANEHLIIPGHLPQRNVHRICGELTPEQSARRYSDEIREFFKLDPGEFPHFDVLQFGMGPDAHTASLFPGERLITDREGIAAAVVAVKPPPNRVTLLPGVLLAARNAVFLVAGEDKADAVHNVLHKPFDPMKYPAQIVSQQGRRVNWFLDQAAARLMN